VQIVEIDPCRDERWEAFVRGHDQALIYHHPAWLSVLASGYGRDPVGVTGEDPDGGLVAVLPLVRVREPFMGRA